MENPLQMRFQWMQCVMMAIKFVQKHQPIKQMFIMHFLFFSFDLKCLFVNETTQPCEGGVN